MSKRELFLGVDGGGTHCRARLCDASGQWLSAETRRRLVPPAGDAVDGALRLARLAAQSAAAA